MKSKFIKLLFGIIISMSTMGQETLIIGHRGCRGIMPENTIPAFQKALDLGADGIEWDVVVNKDKQLVISHEPFFQNSYCLDSNGNEIKNESDFNIYNLSHSEIEKFDCGSKGNSKYPEQEKFKVGKPTVQEAFEVLNLENKTLLFEVKSEEKEYGKSQPYPKEFVQLILAEVENYKWKNNIIFMSFDANIINEINKQNPTLKCVYLTFSPFKNLKKSLKDLNFTPYAMGMYHPTINKKEIQYAHENNIKVFAWTVNKEKDASHLKKLGIDALITDFPNIFIKT